MCVVGCGRCPCPSGAHTTSHTQELAVYDGIVASDAGRRSGGQRGIYRIGEEGEGGGADVDGEAVADGGGGGEEGELAGPAGAGEDVAEGPGEEDVAAGEARGGGREGGGLLLRPVAVKHGTHPARRPASHLLPLLPTMGL